jgi:hypothetical protein
MLRVVDSGNVASVRHPQARTKRIHIGERHSVMINMSNVLATTAFARHRTANALQLFDGDRDDRQEHLTARERLRDGHLYGCRRARGDYAACASAPVSPAVSSIVSRWRSADQPGPGSNANTSMPVSDRAARRSGETRNGTETAADARHTVEALRANDASTSLWEGATKGGTLDPIPGPWLNAVGAVSVDKHENGRMSENQPKDARRSRTPGTT